MTIPERIKKMNKPSGFDELFDKELVHHSTYKQAYEALESEYEEVFGERRYKNYESYRKARSRRIKTKMQKAREKRLRDQQETK